MLVSLKRAVRHRRQRDVYISLSLSLSLYLSLSLSSRVASFRKRALAQLSRSFPRSLVLSLSLSPSLSHCLSLAFPFVGAEANVTYNTIIPITKQRFTSREDSGRQRRSRTFAVRFSRCSRDFVRLIRRPRWRDKEAAREESKRKRERKRKRTRRQSGRTDANWIDESCAVPSIEKKPRVKITETRARFYTRKENKQYY